MEDKKIYLFITKKINEIKELTEEDNLILFIINMIGFCVVIIMEFLILFFK